MYRTGRVMYLTEVFKGREGCVQYEKDVYRTGRVMYWTVVCTGREGCVGWEGCVQDVRGVYRIGGVCMGREGCVQDGRGVYRITYILINFFSKQNFFFCTRKTTSKRRKRFPLGRKGFIYTR